VQCEVTSGVILGHCPIRDKGDRSDALRFIQQITLDAPKAKYEKYERAHYPILEQPDYLRAF
jgi:hypothetical protein